MAKMDKDGRAELIKAVTERYGAAERSEKTRILDEFSTLTGFHRMHAIAVLNRAPSTRERRSARPVRRVYDEAAKQALIVLWEASDRICGKRLKALIPALVAALERPLRANDGETPTPTKATQLMVAKPSDR